ncbi:MAG TPA: rhamnogalacturonan lyase B N-terminal domain-containing protein [Pseudonocardiaceae bacterium]|nr:rhamnogalacturonan lyase B N-terminal domain-containing protein [Pseudonocardiaceae bacterium]
MAEPFARRTFLTAIGAGGLALGASGLLSSQASASTFGLTNSGGFFTVDTGAGLVFKIRQSNGDLTSLRRNGVELQSQSRFSHVESGLGSGATVTAVQNGNIIVITESATNWYGSGVIHHYLVARNGDSAIYMATIVDNNGAGELRWIQEFDRGVITNMNTDADVNGGTAIESSDVFLVNGQTRSKYYGNRQAINLTPRGVTGNGVGAFMDYGNRESSSGGPFFRDIEQQGSTTIQLYNYMWSGHNDTENQRLGVLNGPYALIITDGSVPAAPDLTFMYSLGLQGAVPLSGRGFVAGKAVGVPGGSVVGFANGQAQYWVISASDGNFTSPAMKPGTYTQTLYQNELPVATRSVTVNAGSTNSGQNITSTFTTPTAIFRIGTWDGAPTSFKNSNNLTTMHPSDTRMASWGPTTYVVGASSTSDFPAYQWIGVNNPTTVSFTLSSGQLAARTVRIGLSAAYNNGRPQISVNNWTSSIPSPSTQPKSRSLTIGTYRGNEALFTYQVPASAFVTGTNTMKISIVSGDSGTAFLSPGVSFDCVELF